MCSQARSLAILCLVAVLAVATAASSGWVVVCVGDDGHRAIELPHPVSDCRSFPAFGDPSGTALAGGGGDCLDLPVAGLALVSHRPSVHQPGESSLDEARPGTQPRGDFATAPRIASFGVDRSAAVGSSPDNRLRSVILRL